MNQALVSVVIPTYGHARYVEATLASVLAQSYDDLEIIVVNDGSPDDTASVLAPYAAKGRIRYIEQANAGQAAARNSGLLFARGEFVAFLDDDDLWPSDAVEWRVAALNMHASWVGVGGTHGDVGPNGVLVPRSPRGEPVRLLTTRAILGGCPFITPGQVLFRTVAVRNIGGFDATLWGADDFDLYLRLAARLSVACVDRCALYYRLHDQNASRDLGRMYDNLRTAACKNLPLVAVDERKTAWLEWQRWIYQYLGRRVACAVWRREPRAKLWADKLSKELIGVIFRDAQLLKLILRDLTLWLAPSWSKPLLMRVVRVGRSSMSSTRTVA